MPQGLLYRPPQCGCLQSDCHCPGSLEGLGLSYPGGANGTTGLILYVWVWAQKKVFFCPLVVKSNRSHHCWVPSLLLSAYMRVSFTPVKVLFSPPPFRQGNWVSEWLISPVLCLDKWQSWDWSPGLPAELVADDQQHHWGVCPCAIPTPTRASLTATSVICNLLSY